MNQATSETSIGVIFVLSLLNVVRYKTQVMKKRHDLSFITPDNRQTLESKTKTLK